MDRELSTVAGLLVDVLAEPLAKKTILRKSAELKGRREALQARYRICRIKRTMTPIGWPAVRRKVLEAKVRWEAVASPAQLNQLIGEFVGPSIVTAEGKLLDAGATKTPHTGIPCTG